MTSQRWGENIWKTYILIMTWTQYTSKSYNSMVRQPNKKCANALQLNKSRKSCLTSLVTKGMQMKTMMIYSYIPTRKNKVKNKCHQRHGTTVTLIKCVCVCAPTQVHRHAHTLSCFGQVHLFVTLACQAPLSMGISALWQFWGMWKV